MATVIVKTKQVFKNVSDVNAFVDEQKLNNASVFADAGTEIIVLNDGDLQQSKVICKYFKDDKIVSVNTTYFDNMQDAENAAYKLAAAKAELWLDLMQGDYYEFENNTCYIYNNPTEFVEISFC